MNTMSQNDPSHETLREQNRSALLEMLRLMGEFDHSRASAADGGYAGGQYPDFYAEDGELHIPFLPEGIKNFRRGRDEHASDAELRFRLFSDFSWDGAFEVHDCLDPTKFVVFAASTGHSRSGVSYANRYVFFAEMAHGRLQTLREFADMGRLAAIADDLAAVSAEVGL